MFDYVTEEERIKIITTCEAVLEKVKEMVIKNFIIDYKFLGIDNHSFLTKNNTDGIFDVDYILLISKDKRNLLDYPIYVKNIFINVINKLNPEIKCVFLISNKSVIAYRLIDENGLTINLNIHILMKGKSGTMYKIFYNSSLLSIIWFRLRDTKYFFTRYKELIDSGHFKDLKDSYILKKNHYYYNTKNEETSFLIFIESVNEIWNQYN